MICPFCKVEMTRHDYSSYYSYHCGIVECMSMGEMPKYISVHHNGTEQISCRELIIGDLHIKQNFDTKYTEVSKLEACFLIDVIYIPCIIPVDLDNLDTTLARIKRLMIFS